MTMTNEITKILYPVESSAAGGEACRNFDYLPIEPEALWSFLGEKQSDSSQEVTSVTAKEELEGKVKLKEEFEEKPVRKGPIELLELAQNEKFKRYDAEYTQYLMSKYFSDKTIFGGNIFDVKMTIDGEPIKVSRFPGYLSYADPANFQDESSRCSSNSTVETPPCSVNGNQPSKNGN